MCKMQRDIFIYVFVLLLLLLLADALRAEEQGPWYLISESELRSIEQYKQKSELEKANWLSQVRQLNLEANKLHQESVSLNSQLSQARDWNWRLEQSFNEFEIEASQTISYQYTLINLLESDNKKQAGQIRRLWAIIISAGAVVSIFFGIKALRFIKVLPF